ncbi:hypothetical protein [Sphingomonas oryzagri]
MNATIGPDPAASFVATEVDATAAQFADQPLIILTDARPLFFWA